MPSITTWTRLEPRCRSADLTVGLQARVHDPLWLLARQWQMGEFAGEDGGTPVAARVTVSTSPLDGFVATATNGGAVDAPPLGTVPLRARIEREASSSNARQRAERGLSLLRLLSANGLAKYRDLFIRTWPLERTHGPTVDDAADRLFTACAGRVPDGVTMAAALRSGVPASLPVDPDRAAVATVVKQWVSTSWSTEPASTDESCWAEHRLEYAFSTCAGTSDDSRSLLAPEYDGGALDWYSFDWHYATLQPTGVSPSTTQTRTLLPTTVTFRGMPARRFWELEDARVDFGAQDAGAEDLARLLVTEFAVLYGGDWFVVPLDLAVGALHKVTTLEVRDTFGTPTQVPHYSAADGNTRARWRFGALTAERLEGELPDDGDQLLLLPPTFGAVLEGPAIEEVRFARDPGADLAWALECTVEGAAGTPFDRQQAWLRRAVTPMPPDAPLRWRLGTQVPDYSIPLAPTPMDANGRWRLQRAGLPDDADVMRPPLGRILEPDNMQLDYYPEEVSRAGARVTRSWRLARWIDGTTWLWLGRTRHAGSGEISSGLRFDDLEGA